MNQHRPDESDLLRRVRDTLDDDRHRPVKELGLPDYREREDEESHDRDAAWERGRDARRAEEESGEGG